MRVLELSLRNYRVFEEVDLELPARVIGIFGINGSGKTTLLDSLRFALYGESRTDKKQIRTHGILTDALVRVVFEHGGRQYEIRRRIKGKNHSTEAELFVGERQLATGVTEVNQEVQQLLRMDQKVFRASVFAEQKQLDAFSEVRAGERKEMVLRLLGIRPVDVARSAARKESRDQKALADRLQASLPDLAEQEARLEKDRAEAEEAREQAASAADALKEVEARAAEASKTFDASDEVRERVEKIAVEKRGYEQQAEAHGRKESQLTERIEELERDLVELAQLEVELASLEGAAKRFAEGQRAIEAARVTEELGAQLAAIPVTDAEAALAALEAAQRDRDRAREEAAKAGSVEERAAEDLAAAQETLARATKADPSQPCPTCGRPLGDDFEEYVSHCKKAVAEAKKRAATASKAKRSTVEALEDAEGAFAEATAKGETVRLASENRSRLEERLTESRGQLEILLKAFGGELPDASRLEGDASRETELRRRVTELGTERKHLQHARKDLEVETKELAACRSRIEELDEEAGKLAFDSEDHARLKKERDESARLVEQARGAERSARDALGALERELAKLEGLIAQAREISEEVARLREEARYLGRTTQLLDGFRDHLVGRIGPELSREAEALFRELTASEYDDLKIDEQTLAIQIADGTDFFPIERFSGSETDLANLALRVAISKHLSYMSGTDIGLLVLDEVLGSLDVERKDLFVRAMGRLSNHFHQLFVITHAEQVKDQFQAVVEVQKVGRRRSVAILV